MPQPDVGWRALLQQSPERITVEDGLDGVVLTLPPVTSIRPWLWGALFGGILSGFCGWLYFTTTSTEIFARASGMEAAMISVVMLVTVAALWLMIWFTVMFFLEQLWPALVNRRDAARVEIREHVLLLDEARIPLPDLLFIEDGVLPVLVSRGGERTPIPAALNERERGWLVSLLHAVIASRQDGSHADVPRALRQLSAQKT